MKYDLYGITIETPFPCPELPASAREADVAVKWGAVEEPSYAWRERGVCYRAAPGRYLLSIEGVADFLVEDGRSVTIARPPDGDEERLRLHFYHEVMGALLWQRGSLLLKGCVLEKGGRGIGFIGPTPCGKTMTAARLMQRGYRVVSDGFCRITGDVHPIAQPGYPRLLLWAKSLDMLGLSSRGLHPVRRGMQRFYLPVEQSFRHGPVKLETLYVHGFCADPGLSVERAAGARKLAALLDNGYRPELAAPLGVMGAAGRIAMALAKQTEVRILRYNDTLVPFDEYIERLDAELEGGGQ